MDETNNFAFVETTIPKPERTNAYTIHRMVAELANGIPHLWRDNGKNVVIRSLSSLSVKDRGELPSTPCEKESMFAPSDVRMFQLRASVGVKNKGRHRYFSVGDAAPRNAWLKERSESYGFEILALHNTSKKTCISGRRGGSFTVDQTDYTGCLKITNPDKFFVALTQGISGGSKGFGFGMLILN